jgi:hypothetical protein
MCRVGIRVLAGFLLEGVVFFVWVLIKNSFIKKEEKKKKKKQKYEE